MKSLRVTSQSGQALIAGLIVLMIAFAGLIVLFSRSQITIEKQRLTSASDAAAYSAALWRARVMNFDAYANRAIVAQEVAVAQAVTLTSWAKYFETFTQNSATVAAAYPPLGAVMSTIATLAETSRVVTQAAAEAEIFARAAKDTGYKFLLEDGQFLMGLTANGFALSMITTEVARANHPDYHAYVLPDQGTSFAFVKHYESDEDRARLKDVVLRSLDPFTGQSRDENLRLLLLPSLCFGRSLSFSSWFQHLRKRGGTSLSDDMERWEAVDTTSLHNFRPRGFFGGCREHELAPVGYGASEAADTENQSAVLSNENDINKNFSSKALASGQIKSFGNYGGLSKIRELDYEQLSNKKFPVSEIAVLTRIKKEDLRTADTTNLGVGRFRTVDELDDNRLKAISAAQVYFRKPTQSASGEADEIEYASLFSPYWQARLIAPTEAQRALAAAAK
jgi:hypothetical protein